MAHNEQAEISDIPDNQYYLPAYAVSQPNSSSSWFDSSHPSRVPFNLTNLWNYSLEESINRNGVTALNFAHPNA
jgi:hypothetical protein